MYNQSTFLRILMSQKNIFPEVKFRLKFYAPSAEEWAVTGKTVQLSKFRN